MVSRNEALQKVGALKREISSANGPFGSCFRERLKPTVASRIATQNSILRKFDLPLLRCFNTKQSYNHSQTRPGAPIISENDNLPPQNNNLGTSKP
jgi:hypothetical protein